MGRRGRQRQALKECPSLAVQTGRVDAGLVDGGLVDGGQWARARGARWLGVMLLSAVTWGQVEPAFAQDEPAEAASSSEAAASEPSEVSAKIDEAKKQVEQLDYPAAQQTLFKVVQAGKATPEELAQAYFNLGVVEAGLGNDVESTDSFYLALMIQPSLLFPEGGSPKIRQRLNEARGRVTEVGVLQAHGTVQNKVLEVHVDNDPLNMVKRVDVTMTRDGGQSGKVTLAKGALRAEVESGVQTIQVGLFDDAGNQLESFEVDPKGKAGAGEVVRTPPSVWENWGLWAGVSGALALGGTYFIMEAGSLDGDIKDARDAPNPNPAEVSRLQDNQDRVGLYGVIGFSLAGAAAVTSGALLLFGGGEKGGEASSEATLLPSLAPGHVGANFSLRF
jgi:hypothetical protein